MKVLRFAVPLGLLMFLVAQIAHTKVKDTPHNLSGLVPGKTSVPGGTEQVCIACHTPHFSETDGGEAVNYLWNHELSAGGWTLHEDADPASVMSSASRLCLSCHDGTVAIDAFGVPETADSTGQKPKSGTVFVPFTARLGTDLTNHHPVGVDYPLGNSRYEQPAISDPTDPDFSVDFSVTSTDATLSDPVGASLHDGKVQCDSCHFAHGSRASDTRMFLRVDNSQSKLCSQCHVN
jgi:predicted CXXCH cytochrome family protein